METLRGDNQSLRDEVQSLREREATQEPASEPTPTPVAASGQAEEPDRQAISEEPQGPPDQSSGETPEGGGRVTTPREPQVETRPEEERREPDRQPEPTSGPAAPTPPQATATATANNGGRGLAWGLALLGLFLAIGLGAIALAIVLRNDDDNGGNGTAVIDPGAKFAADTFGGNARDWAVIAGSGGSGWKYTGSSELEFTIPSGYRIDYPGATCEVAGSSGVYGPVKITRGGPVSVWRVGSETKCPVQAGGSGQQPPTGPVNQPPAVVNPPSGGGR